MLMGAIIGGPPAPPIIIILKVTMTLVMLVISSHAWVSYGAAGGRQGEEDKSSADALLKFKSRLSYAEELENWNPSVTSPCSGEQGLWHGVLCSGGEVWGLQLENMNLSGEIDVESLVPLAALRTISLMHNSFGGPMPDWRKLGALKSLFLSDNHFSGKIPDDAFAQMSSLKKVYLANNDFVGTIPTSLATPRLLELRLENNGFTGPLPDFEPGLKDLDVSNNQLQGPIPQALSTLSPSSFAGNKDLCGKPLDSPCNPLGPLPDEKPSPVQPPATSTTSSSDHHNSKSSLVRIIAIVMAALLALAAVLVLLAIYRSSRKRTQPRLGRVVSSLHKQNSGNHRGGKAVQMQGVEPKALPRMNSSSKKSDQPSKLSFIRNDRQRFDLQDLLRASAEVLGSGNFGSSYKAVLMDGQAVVVKRFKQMNNVGKEEFHEHMRRLGRLLHPNLMPLVAYYYRKEEKLLVFDYVQNGSLANHLHGKHSSEKPALDWPTRLKIVKGVAKGLAYLHSELPSVYVPHGHLKSSNVVLEKSFQPLLMDYALVPVVNPDQVHQLLVAYKSPEYAQQGRTTRKTDVWNLGILILEILTGRIPTSYLSAAPGYDQSHELAGWVRSIAAAHEQRSTTTRRSVLDPEMENTNNSEGEMQKLLKIGVACCEEELDHRWDLKEAVEKIEDVKDRDIDIVSDDYHI